MPSQIDKYNCRIWDGSGPGTIYALSIPVGDADITATMVDGANDMLDIFFLGLSECYSGTYQTADTETLTITNLNGGTYHIAIDDYNGQQGSINLEVDRQH